MMIKTIEDKNDKKEQNVSNDHSKETMPETTICFNKYCLCRERENENKKEDGRPKGILRFLF